MRRVPKSYSFEALELHGNVLAGDVGRVRKQLRAGVAVDILDLSGNTPLHKAAWQCDVAMTQLLLEFGSDTNARGSAQKTPLELVDLRLRGLAADSRACDEPQRVAALLRDVTSGHDVVLGLHGSTSEAGSARLWVTSLAGLEMASIHLDPAERRLCEVQEDFAELLDISPARLRLILPDGTLPSELDNMAPISQLLHRVEHCAGIHCTLLHDANACAADCLTLNQLSSSSVGLDASTCAVDCLALNQLSCSSVSTYASASDVLQAESLCQRNLTELFAPHETPL